MDVAVGAGGGGHGATGNERVLPMRRRGKKTKANKG